jgi:hypothetical protein
LLQSPVSATVFVPQCVHSATKEHPSFHPLLPAKKKRGVYAIPNEGQVVIIEFLCWNPAYPYAAGMRADEYEADGFGKDQFVITDGEGCRVRRVPAPVRRRETK